MNHYSLSQGIHFVNGFVSSPKAILLQLLEKAFPTLIVPDSLVIRHKRKENEIEKIQTENSSNQALEI